MSKGRLAGWLSAAVLLLVVSPACAAETAEKKGNAGFVSSGKEVSLEYTLTLDNKEVIDTNVGGDALTYTQGSGQIIKGLESALEGMKVGESKQVTVAPENGYGSVNPKAFQEVPKENVPAEALEVGTELVGRDGQGRVVRPRVAEVKDQTVVLDFNHPLAGKTLHFNVKILDVK